MNEGLVPITLSVNNEKYNTRVQPYWTLAEVLREKLGITGTKTMCNQGACGSCTVLIDGKPVLACLTLAIECEERGILTIEGLADQKTGALHPIQKAFIEHSGMQCGVCTPGIILSAKALLDGNLNPSEDDVRSSLSGHLCRCGNYKRITESVLAAGDMMREEK